MSPASIKHQALRGSDTWHRFQARLTPCLTLSHTITRVQDALCRDGHRGQWVHRTPHTPGRHPAASAAGSHAARAELSAHPEDASQLFVRLESLSPDTALGSKRKAYHPRGGCEASSRLPASSGRHREREAGLVGVLSVSSKDTRTSDSASRPSTVYAPLPVHASTPGDSSLRALAALGGYGPVEDVQLPIRCAHRHCNGLMPPAERAGGPTPSSFEPPHRCQRRDREGGARMDLDGQSVLSVAWQVDRARAHAAPNAYAGTAGDHGQAQVRYHRLVGCGDDACSWMIRVGVHLLAVPCCRGVPVLLSAQCVISAWCAQLCDSSECTGPCLPSLQQQQVYANYKARQDHISFATCLGSVQALSAKGSEYRLSCSR